MSLLKKYLYTKWAIIILVLIAVVGFFLLRRGNDTPKIEYATAKITNVIEKVSVTGKILPASKANLAFEKGGVIKSIPKKIGEPVKKGEIIAVLNTESDAAALANASAQLKELMRGLRPEEYAANEAAVYAASTSLANAQKNAASAVRDGYVKAQNAVLSYADTFFNNPQSPNPTINILTQSSAIQSSINQKRLLVTETLLKWKILIDNMGAQNDFSPLLAQSEQYLDVIKNFMSDLSSIVNYLNPGNSALAQTTINSYVATMSNGQSVLNTAVSAIIAADASLNNANASYFQSVDKFNVELAGASSENIAAARAKVAQAEAELNKNKIISPIDGTLTRSDIEVGEFVRSGDSLFSVQSDNSFKIEANVPEADIAKVSIDNAASVTLDAYGSSVVFTAKVVAIDPAETILEGVPTYKVTLVFDTNDSRIRSGMTANTEIFTRRRDNVVAIPSRAVIDTAGQKTVRVLHSDGKTFETVNITSGLKGSDGLLEVVSGLYEGDKVITYLK